MKYRFHRAAAGEHLDNVAFYESRQPGLGADYLAEFEAVMAHVCTAPDFYPVIDAPDIHKAGLKRFPFHIFIAPGKRKLSCLPSPTNAAARHIGRGGC
jgi:hypothetical protein